MGGLGAVEEEMSVVVGDFGAWAIGVKRGLNRSRPAPVPRHEAISLTSDISWWSFSAGDSFPTIHSYRGSQAGASPRVNSVVFLSHLAHSLKTKREET